MYEANLTAKGDRINLSVSDPDDANAVDYAFPMSVDEALNLRLWLEGMLIKAPIEVRIGKHLHWLDWEIWLPMREALNIWYGTYYDDSI